VVGLNGSPNCNGNTATLIGWALEGCREAGARIEWIHLADHEIGYCRGCGACLATGSCPIDDGLEALRETLCRADGIVVGSPVYGGRMTAQLKTMVDRWTQRALYLGLFEDQWSIGVATSGLAPTRGVAREIASFFGQRSSLLGARTASLRHGYRPLTPQTHHRLRARARRAGRRLVHDIRTRPLLRIGRMQRLWINVLRRRLLPRLITRHPEPFAAVIEDWGERGWLPGASRERSRDRR
jgi:hypothetical protein